MVNSTGFNIPTFGVKPTPSPDFRCDTCMYLYMYVLVHVCTSTYDTEHGGGGDQTLKSRASVWSISYTFFHNHIITDMHTQVSTDNYQVKISSFNKFFLLQLHCQKKKKEKECVTPHSSKRISNKCKCIV